LYFINFIFQIAILLIILIPIIFTLNERTCIIEVKNRMRIVAMLRYSDLHREISNKAITFSGTIRKESFLVTLGSPIQLFSRRAGLIIDPYDAKSVDQAYGQLIDDWTTFEIQSGDFILCAAEEFVSLDMNHFGLFTTLSHSARLGLMSSPTSFFVDPGFSGHLTFELHNFCPHGIRLYRQMPVAKIVVFPCHSKTNAVDGDSAKPHFYYGARSSIRSQFDKEFKRPSEGG
jgi:deoxycytidine triphosphate deaminase